MCGCRLPKDPTVPFKALVPGLHSNREALAQKRLAARRVYTSCSVVFQYCTQKGIHAVWEMSERSLAWRLPVIQKLCDKYQLRDIVTQGCAVNLRDRSKGRFSK